MFRDRHHVPKIHAEPVLSGSELIDTTAVEAARAWKFSQATLLVLAGDVGTGKSLAAAWALWDRLVMSTPKNPWGQKIAPDVRLWIAAPHLARLTAWSDEVAECERSPLLVLDDLGEEEASPKSIAILSSLITTRMANGLPTIITTNLDQKTFRDRYGERIIDRIRQSGLDENGKSKWWVRCTGPSLRGKVEPKPVDRSTDDVEVPEEVGPRYGADDMVVAIARLKATNDGEHNRRAEPGEQGE